MKTSVIAFLIAFIGISHFSFSQNSVLSEGNWYKMAVDQTGIYRIGYNDLVNWGIDPSLINPKNIRIFGNVNGMLPEENSAFRYDDLQENAIFVFGEEDETFDPGDYILFYGEGPTVWKLNEATGHFEHQVNIYSDVTCYFLTAGSVQGKRIEIISGPAGDPTQTITSFNSYFAHENEDHNLIRSGKAWYGEVFTDTTPLLFDLSFDGLMTSQPLFLRSAFANRIFENTTMDISINGNPISSVTLSSIPFISSNYARKKTDTVSFLATNPEFSLGYTFNQATDSTMAWLDYFEVNYMHELNLNSTEMNFRNTASVGNGNISLFSISNADATTHVWNVIDPLNVNEAEGNLTSDQYEIKIATDSLIEFIAFKGTDFPAPEFTGMVPNQNLHGIAGVDYVIVTTEDFEGQAQQLAEFHQNEDGLSAAVVLTGQIYNEFSSGIQDVTAIRDFLRHMYKQSEGQYPRYVLLFGDASYDYKDRITGNTNFVPSLETVESLNIVNSAVWDDFFTWMDTDEGLTGTAYFALGRIPIKSSEEAQNAVAKIINYANNSDFGNWKNEVMFAADDEDGNLHLNQADSLASILSANFGELNILKNYFDFFELIETPDGPRYPEATEYLDNSIENGLLLLNYTGHGGTQGWAHEQVLTLDDIQSWQDLDQLPFIYVATADFLRFDDPESIAGGEVAVLKDDGGCIGIFGATRPSFSLSNFMLNIRFMEYLTSEDFNTNKRFGDFYNFLKQNTGYQITTYSSVLLGDPALKLTFPDNHVETTTINGNTLPMPPDTLNPGEELTVEGMITDQQGNTINNFNGTLIVTVYERPYIRQTLGNTSLSYVTDVVLQDSIMLQLQSEVVNGQFEFIFTLPVEISQDFGKIKLSYYAFGGNEDASGYYSDLTVGGNPIGIAKLTSDNGFVVYPTITEGKLTLLNNGNVVLKQVQITDLSGKKLYIHDFNGNEINKKTELDVSLFPSGFYLLHIYTYNGCGDFKFIKK